jgi:hypothetical protein
MQLDYVQSEIERMRTQIHRQRGEIHPLQKAGIWCAPISERDACGNTSIVSSSAQVASESEVIRANKSRSINTPNFGTTQNGRLDYGSKERAVFHKH